MFSTADSVQIENLDTQKKPSIDGFSFKKINMLYK
jgi:hypothetical protein